MTFFLEMLGTAGRITQVAGRRITLDAGIKPALYGKSFDVRETGKSFGVRETGRGDLRSRGELFGWGVEAVVDDCHYHGCKPKRRRGENDHGD